MLVYKPCVLPAYIQTSRSRLTFAGQVNEAGADACVGRNTDLCDPLIKASNQERENAPRQRRVRPHVVLLRAVFEGPNEQIIVLEGLPQAKQTICNPSGKTRPPR